MGKILLKFDNNLKQEDIIIPLIETSGSESGGGRKDPNISGYQQTSVYGIVVPIVQINNIVVAFNDIKYFQLESVGHIPTVRVIVNDRYKLHSMIDTPSSDNKLRVQIIPPCDNTYKKINMTFYITEFNSYDNGTVGVEGVFLCKKFTEGQYKAFGEVDTYKLFEDIAKDTSLGFATNIENSDAQENVLGDKRYMYCDYKSYQQLFNQEIRRAPNDDTHIYDWWIDLYNNINLVNVYERYNTVDKDEDMMVWCTSGRKHYLEDEEQDPIQLPAYIHNNPLLQPSSLFVKNYEKINSFGAQISRGTDKVFTIYEVDSNECKSYLIQDGDVKRCNSVMCEYIGEVYGPYNYLKAEACYDTYKQKMNLETIRVTLSEPIFGLMRGDKVNFLWFDNDTTTSDKRNMLEDTGIIQDVNLDVQSITNTNPVDRYGSFEQDMSVSGQYMIVACSVIYEDYEWKYVLDLQRPSSKTPHLLNLPDTLVNNSNSPSISSNINIVDSTTK